MAFVTSLKPKANYLTEAMHLQVRERKKHSIEKNANSCQLKDGCPFR
jgi:hypothetical protein